METEELTNALESLITQLTAMVEMLTNMVGNLFDTPLGVIIFFIVIVPMIFSFCSDIFSTIFKIIVGTIGRVMEVVFFIFCKLPLEGYELVKRLSSKKKIPTNLNEYQVLKEEVLSVKFEDPSPKKVKPTTPDQDLAASLKSNTLDP